MKPSSSHAMALEEPLDLLFADIAIRVQLSQTAHDKAIQRYETIAEQLERAHRSLTGELRQPSGVREGSTTAR